MLVLSRKVGERVAIDWLGQPQLGTVHVSVLEINGSRVRLGFDGPPDARFLRTEIAEKGGEPPPSAGVADVLVRIARVLDAEAGGYGERDRLLLCDTAAYLRARAGEQV